MFWWSQCHSDGHNFASYRCCRPCEWISYIKFKAWRIRQMMCSPGWKWISCMWEFENVWCSKLSHLVSWQVHTNSVQATHLTQVNKSELIIAQILQNTQKQTLVCCLKAANQFNSLDGIVLMGVSEKGNDALYACAVYSGRTVSSAGNDWKHWSWRTSPQQSEEVTSHPWCWCSQ